MGLFNKSKKLDVNSSIDNLLAENDNLVDAKTKKQKADEAARQAEIEKEANAAKAGDSEEGLIETEELISHYTDLTISHFTKDDTIHINLYERGIIDQKELLKRVKTQFLQAFKLSEEAENKIIIAFMKFLWSYDIVDQLIDDDEISDIKIYDWDRIRVKRLGKRETSPIKFRNEKHFKSFVEHVAVKNKVSISDLNAAQNFVDKKSSEKAILRFNITTGFINSSEKPVMHIRKIPKQKRTTEQLIGYKFFTPGIVKYIREQVKDSGGILIAGKGASGKTTFLNWLMDEIPTDKSGLVIQENEELFSDHPDMMFQHTVLNRGEGKIEYTLQDLARNGLLTDLDYFIIGEIKGGEALYLLNAAYTGHKCIATVHGASSTEAMNKLADYVKYNSDYKKGEILEMFMHLDTVIFMRDFGVREISKIVGFDKEKETLIYENIDLDKLEEDYENSIDK